MRPPQKRPPVRLVEENEAPSDGDWLAFHERRMKKWGAPPPKPAPGGTQLMREKLAVRRLADVVAHAVVDMDQPPRMSHALLVIAGALAGFSLLATGLAALVAGR